MFHLSIFLTQKQASVSPDTKLLCGAHIAVHDKFAVEVAFAPAFR